MKRKRINLRTARRVAGKQKRFVEVALPHTIIRYFPEGDRSGGSGKEPAQPRRR